MQEDRSGKPGSEERFRKEPEEGEAQQKPAPEQPPAPEPPPRAESPVTGRDRPFGERSGGEVRRPAASPATPGPGETGEGVRGAEEVPPQTGGEVMSSLPRTRPQRRSTRRTQPSSGRARRSGAAAGQRTGRTRTPARARTAAQAQPKATSAARTTPAARTPVTPGRTRRPRAGELAVNTAVQAAKLPFRTAVAVTRITAGLIGRGLRR